MSVILRHATLLVLLAVLVPALSARAASSEQDRRTVALLPLLGTGLALDELAAVDGTIQREVDGRFGARMLPTGVVRERLDAGARRGLRCDRSVESCQVQLGILCEADLVLVAALAPVVAPTGAQGGMTLQFRLVDVVEASQLAAVTTSLTGLPTGSDVKRLLVQLDDPASRAAMLVVTGPSGAPVVIDGNARGSLPLPHPIADLAPGRHDVVVYTQPLHEVVVELRRGERVEVTAAGEAVLDVAPEPAAPAVSSSSSMPAPPPPRMLALVGGGVLTVVGISSFVAGMIPWLTYDDAVTQLSADEAAVRADPDELVLRAESVRERRETLDTAGKEWTSWGAASVTVGAAAIIVGTALVAIGAFALE